MKEARTKLPSSIQKDEEAATKKQEGQGKATGEGEKELLLQGLNEEKMREQESVMEGSLIKE